MASFTTLDRPRLAARTRIRHDEARNAEVLLFPEGVLVLNSSAAATLALCDGEKSIQDIVDTLSAQLATPVDITDDIVKLLDRLAARGLVEGYAH